MPRHHPHGAGKEERSLRERVVRAAGRLPAGRRVAQRDLARLAALIDVIDKPTELTMAEAVMTALEARPPRIDVATPLLDALERGRESGLSYWLYARTVRGSTSRGVLVFAILLQAAIAFHYCAVGRLAWYTDASAQASLPDNWALVGLAGSAGAVVSLLSRWSPDTSDRSRDIREHAALNGFLRPLIGWLSGSFSFFAYFSGLVSTSAMPALAECGDNAMECNQAWAAAFVVSFVAGFSERWVRDVAARVAQDDEDPDAGADGERNPGGAGAAEAGATEVPAAEASVLSGEGAVQEGEAVEPPAPGAGEGGEPGDTGGPAASR